MTVPGLSYILAIDVYVHMHCVFDYIVKGVSIMEHAAGTYPKTPSPCLCLNLRRASRAVTGFYEQILLPSGLKITQYSLLRHLEHVEPVTISELAKVMRIDRTTLNRNMKPLLEAGFIALNTGIDPRSRQIRLTEAGKAAIRTASGLWDEAQAALRQYLGEPEVEQFNHLIAKLEALVP